MNRLYLHIRSNVDYCAVIIIVSKVIPDMGDVIHRLITQLQFCTLEVFAVDSDIIYYLSIRYCIRMFIPMDPGNVEICIYLEKCLIISSFYQHNDVRIWGGRLSAWKFLFLKSRSICINTFSSSFVLLCGQSIAIVYFLNFPVVSFFLKGCLCF